MAETTRNHIFSKEISQVIIATMVLAPISIEKICLRVISAMRGNRLKALCFTSSAILGKNCQ